MYYNFHCRHLLQLVSRSIGVDLTRLSSDELVSLLLDGYQNLDVVTNRIIIEPIVKYI